MYNSSSYLFNENNSLAGWQTACLLQLDSRLIQLGPSLTNKLLFVSNFLSGAIAIILSEFDEYKQSMVIPLDSFPYDEFFL